MEKYRVIKTIVKGRTLAEPHKYSHKVLAKEGTILVAVKNYERLWGPTELRTLDGKHVCDLGTAEANESCVPITTQVPNVSPEELMKRKSELEAQQKHLTNQLETVKNQLLELNYDLNVKMNQSKNVAN